MNISFVVTFALLFICGVSFGHENPSSNLRVVHKEDAEVENALIKKMKRVNAPKNKPSMTNLIEERGGYVRKATTLVVPPATTMTGTDMMNGTRGLEKKKLGPKRQKGFKKKKTAVKKKVAKEKKAKKATPPPTAAPTTID